MFGGPCCGVAFLKLSLHSKASSPPTHSISREENVILLQFSLDIQQRLFMRILSIQDELRSRRCGEFSVNMLLGFG
jgi:hypothetical protein